MELVHCIYCSASTSGELACDELTDLLCKCRSSNAACGVTGMLLYDHGSFFQVLEGERRTVERLFEKILEDPRHNRVKKVIIEPIAERNFGDWSMAFPHITRQELEDTPGLNDFFTQANSFEALDECKAKNLLAQFKEGKWHASLAGVPVFRCSYSTLNMPLPLTDEAQHSDLA